MNFLFTIIYTVFCLARPQDWLLPGSLARFPFVDLLACSALFFSLIELKDKQIRLPDRDDYLELLMIGLFSAVLMSHVAHAFLSALIKSFIEFGKIFILFFLLVINTTNIKRLRCVIGIFVFSGVLMAIHCILQKHIGYGFAGALPLTGYVHTGRGLTIIRRTLYFGIFNDPNDTALFLVSTIPLVWALSCRKNIYKLWAIALSGVLIYSVYTTQSRSGYFALITTLVFFGIIHLRQKGFLISFILYAIITFLGLPIRIIGGMSDHSALSRMDYWTDVNRVFKKSFIFGVGYGRITNYVENSLVPHNSFVHTYGELGIFGFTFWLGLISLSIYLSLYILKLESETGTDMILQEYGRCAICSLIGYCAASYFLSRSYSLNFILFIAVIAVLIRLIRIRLPEQRLGVSLIKIMIILITGPPLIIIFIYYSIPILRQLFR